MLIAFGTKVQMRLFNASHFYRRIWIALITNQLAICIIAFYSGFDQELQILLNTFYLIVIDD